MGIAFPDVFELALPPDKWRDMKDTWEGAAPSEELFSFAGFDEFELGMILSVNEMWLDSCIMLEFMPT